MAACLEGEREAFVEIVQRHQSLVCAVAWEQTGRLAVSEEIAQETFVTAWRKLGELREPGSLRAWLKRIAHGLSVDWVRKQKPTASVEELDLLACGDPWPDEAAADREENALVWKAVESLPEATRLPLILFYREEQNIAAVAHALDLSEEVVRQRLSRGRAALRDRLAEVAEQVLGKSRTGAVFTFSVMAAIGGLALPAALAAVAFSGTSALAAGSLTAGAAPVLTTSAAAGTVAAATPPITLFAAMSISKITLTIAAALAVLLIPVGWSIRRHQTDAASDSPGMRPLHDKIPPPGGSVPDFKSSALYAEWQRLHEEHGTTKEAMPALYKAISDIKDTFRRRAFRAALIAEWVELDAPGALTHFRSGGRNDMAEQAMREWMLRDPHAAVAALMGSGAGWESIGRTLLGDIARLTPELVPAVAAQLPAASQPQWDTTVKDAFAVLAGKDLEYARAAAEMLAGPHRDQALAGVAAAWAKHDPQAALAWTQALPEGTSRTEATRALLMAWAGKDPAGALDRVGLVPPGGDMTGSHSDVASRMLTAAAEKDFGATMRWLKENPGKIGFQSMNGMMSLVADKLIADTAGTLAYLKKEAPAGMDRVLSNALLNQGYKHAAEIRAWLDAQPPGPFVEETRLALINGTAWHDPTALVAWVKEMPAEQKTPEKLIEIARRLLNSGSDFSRIDELIASSPPELSTALVKVGFNASGGDGWPGGDVKPWLARLDQLPAGERAQASAILAANWTVTDPDAATAWAAALPDENTRKQTYSAIAGRWAQADSYEASQWIATLPSGAERDAAVGSLVQTIGVSDPDSAWKWARSISSEILRHEAMANAIAVMAMKDPAVGKAALAGIGAELPTEMRTSLEGILHGSHLPSRPSWLKEPIR